MSLPDLATLDDVVALLQRDLTPSEQTNATRLLGMASSVVRKYVRQDITQTVNDVVTLPGNWSNVLELPQRPVTAVSSVVMNGATLPTTQWRLVDSRLFIGTGSWQTDYGTMLWGGPALYGPAGSTAGPQATGASWQGPQASVTVTYTHGYAEVPGDVVNVVAGLVALAVASPVGVNMEQVGGYKVQYSRSEGGSMRLTAEDKAALSYLRKRAVSSEVAPLR
jgi:hypothetical protein